MTLKQRGAILWRLLRPYTLVASIIPVLIGTGLALTQSHFHTGRFIAFLVAAMLIQSATNMFNEYFDFRRGLDNAEMIGIAGAIVRDGVRPRTILALAWGFIGASVILGVYLCTVTDWWLALIGSVCILVAFLYSGGPVPLSYTPFGELAASVAMGPVIVMIGYFIQTDAMTPAAIMASLPIGLLIGGLLLGNNIRDLDHDIKGGRHTIAILLGPKGGRRLFAAVYLVSYLLVLALVAIRWLTPWSLVVLLTVPTATKVVRGYFATTDHKQLQVAFKGTAMTLMQFGMLMFVGLVLGAYV